MNATRCIGSRAARFKRPLSELTCFFNGRGAGVFELAPQKFIL